MFTKTFFDSRKENCLWRNWFAPELSLVLSFTVTVVTTMPHRVSKWRTWSRRAGWGMIRTVGLREQAAWMRPLVMLVFPVTQLGELGISRGHISSECENLISGGIKNSRRELAPSRRLSYLLSLLLLELSRLLDLTQGPETLVESNSFLLNVGVWVWQASLYLENKPRSGTQMLSVSEPIMRGSLWVTYGNLFRIFISLFG